MSLNKVLSVIVAVVITIQLCDSNGTKTKNNYSNDATDQPDQPSDGDSVNVTDGTKEANLSESTTVTPTFKSNIKIDDQKFTQNTSGEYKHEILFSNGNYHAEHGEYEDHDGTTVFVTRGVFSYYTNEGTSKTTFYIVDEFGYHTVELPPQLSTQDGVYYRPDTGTSMQCGDSKEKNCIDPKLLQLLVG